MNHRGRREDRLREVAEVRSVLDGRLGVPLPLEDDALGLILVEEDVVSQRSGVLAPHDLHRLSGQALEFLDLALVKPESSDTPQLTHVFGLQWLLARIDAIGYQGARPPDRSTRSVGRANHPAALNDDTSIGRAARGRAIQRCEAELTQPVEQPS
jgi:hypothetical protein